MDISLKDRTFSYKHNGKQIFRKVIDMLSNNGEDMYLLYDPINQRKHWANISMFNQMFNATGGVIKGQHYKGDKIGGAKQLQNI